MSRVDIAFHLGISKSCVYNYAFTLGLSVDKTKFPANRISDEIADKIQDLYPEKRNEDIARELGVAISTVYAIARRRCLLKSEAYMAKRYKKQSEELRGTKRTAESIEKMKDSIKRTRRRELRRMLSGEPPQTRIKQRLVPRRIWIRCYSLEKQRGYVRTSDPYLLWYDDSTIRVTSSAKGSEDYMAKKYHLRFEPLPDAERSR